LSESKPPEETEFPEFDPDATIVDPVESGRAASAPSGWSGVDPQATGSGYATLRVGSVLSDRYEIVKMVGKGGMGTVYQAHDRELDRPVALKLIRPELAAHRETLARFKQELILAREVTHPNVVRIFDLGMDRGIRFITMEFIKGRDLKSLIRSEHRFSADEVVDIAVQICSALRAAHDAGIVHRDLKPQNVMLDDDGRVKVMDFGVARSAETTGLTQTGQLIGTPDYMSPEQAKGEPVDDRSDLFSLGIILYEMLVGDLPYQADTIVGVLAKRTQEPAVPPIKKNADVPIELNDVVVRCLQIERELRYQSAQQILDDLETRQAPRLPSPWTRMRYWARRTRPATRWALLALAGLLLGVIVVTVTGRSSLVPPLKVADEVEPISLAILPFRNATGDAEIDWLQLSLAEMLRSDIGQSSRLRTVPSDRVLQVLSDLKLDPAAGLNTATLRRLAEHGNAQMIVQGQYSKLGDRIRIDATLHDFDRQLSTPIKAEAASEAELLAAIGQLAQSIRDNIDLSADAIREIEAASFTPSSDSIEALRFYNDGLRLERQGNYLQALEAFQASVDADAQFALAHARLGQVYANLGRDNEGERASRTAVELSEGLPDYERHLIAANHATLLNDHDQAIASYLRLAEAVPEDPEINFKLADLYEQTGEFGKARERLEKILKYDPNYVDALYALGRVEIRSGRPQRSLDPLNRALTLTVQAENEDGRGRVLNAIGIAYKRLNRPEEALRHYRESLDIRRRLDQKSGIAASLAEIAMVQQALSNLDEARANLEEALELRREIGDRGGIGDSLIGLGYFHDDLGEYDLALRYYKDSLRIQREIGDEMGEALCLNNIGVVYLNKGESGDALTNFEQALRLREKTGIPYELGETLHNLGETSAKLGQYDRALDYYLEALEQMRAAGEDLGVAAALHGIGTMFAAQGRLRQALESQREAVETLEASGEQGYWRFVVTARYGASLAAVGRFDEADTVLDEAAGLAETLQNPALVAQVLNFRGDNHYYRGELERAASRFNEALEQATIAEDPQAILSSRLNQAKIAVQQGLAAGTVATLESLVREAERLSLKYVAAEATVLLARAQFEAGDPEGARRRLRGALNDLERLQLRILLVECRHLLGRIDQAAGDAAGAARHHTQARRILEEIRDEAGDEDPLRRNDLQTVYADLTAAAD